MKEDLVGGQKKLDKDKDGDIDAKDFAKLRSMKKEYGMSGNVMASKNKKSMLSMPIKPASKMKEEKTKETDSEPKMKFITEPGLRSRQLVVPLRYVSSIPLLVWRLPTPQWKKVLLYTYSVLGPLAAAESLPNPLCSKLCLILQLRKVPH